MIEIIRSFTSDEGTAIKNALVRADLLCEHVDTLVTAVEWNGNTLHEIPRDQVHFLEDLRLEAVTHVAKARDLLEPKLGQVLPANSRLLAIDHVFRKLQQEVGWFEIAQHPHPPSGALTESELKSWLAKRVTFGDCPPHIRDPNSIERIRDAASKLQSLVFVDRGSAESSKETPDQAGHGERIREKQANPSIALDELGWEILKLFMREQDGHSILKKADIDDKIAAAFKPRDVTTVRKRLRTLEEHGLLNNLGLKRGWQLSDKGRRFCT